MLFFSLSGTREYYPRTAIAMRRNPARCLAAVVRERTRPSLRPGGRSDRCSLGARISPGQ